MNRGFRTIAVYMVIVLLAMTMIRMTAPVSQEQVPEANIQNYTQLLDSAEAGDLVSVEITTYENTHFIEFFRHFQELYNFFQFLFHLVSPCYIIKGDAMLKLPHMKIRRV